MIKFKKFLLEEKKGGGFGCLMLMYDSKWKAKFTTLTNKIDKEDLYKSEEGFGVETEPHITVKFGIHEQDHDRIFAAVEDLDPVTVKLNSSVSLFENEKFDVIKVGIIGQELRNLNKRICTIFDFTDKFKEYNPHTTIAYVKPGMGKKYLNLESPLLGSFYTFKRLCYSDKDLNKKYKLLK